MIPSDHGATTALYRPLFRHATRRRSPGARLVPAVILMAQTQGNAADSRPDAVSEQDPSSENRTEIEPPGGTQGKAATRAPTKGLGGLTLDRTVVLVGLMGAGKSSIGRRLAQKLGVAFADADAEIELAAGRSIPEIFEELGEPAFRDGERRVIKRLLTDEAPHILATGGGAFMADDTRALIKERGHSIWLDADLDVLFERVSRRSNRPLLKTADPKATLAALKETRSPVYAEADVAVRTSRAPIEVTVETVLDALRTYLQKRAETQSS